MNINLVLFIYKNNCSIILLINFTIVLFIANRIISWFLGGDNLIVGTYDRKMLWFDLDLSTKPYKTLRLHSTAIRSVAFHKRYPLFASGSDDRALIVSHGMVYKYVFLYFIIQYQFVSFILIFIFFFLVIYFKILL